MTWGTLPKAAFDLAPNSIKSPGHVLPGRVGFRTHHDTPCFFYKQCLAKRAHIITTQKEGKGEGREEEDLEGGA